VYLKSEYKMRETNIAMTYVFYPAIFDAVEFIREGPKVLEAMRYYLTAMHLIKGFSPHVSIF
jgi:hypothetical protein